jgi:ribosomal-protein-alanine N-acetyltransferase
MKASRHDMTPDPAQLRLCPMTLAHLDEVVAIEVAAYPYPWSRNNFVDSLAAGYHARCLVDAHGTVLGYMLAMAGVEEMHLLNIAVAPTQQGRGHALRLLRALVAQARATHAACLWLEVRPSNLRARQLYERFGFEQLGVRRAYYPDADGRREDALVMRYLISSADGGHP